MTDYEKGSASWDIGQIMTRHGAHKPEATVCARVACLRRTAYTYTPAPDRLRQALDTPCTCGAGDSVSERTSLDR